MSGRVSESVFSEEGAPPDSWMSYHLVRASLMRSMYQRLKSFRSRGFVAQCYFAVFVPYFLLWYIGLRVGSLFFRGGYRYRLIGFLRTYFWWYMRSRGVEGYLTKPEPAYTGKGMLILSVRQDPMASLLFAQQFSYPVIVPIVPALYRFPMSVFFPWRGLGRCLSVMSYVDHGLDSDSDSIFALLEAGYPVLVYVNPGYVSPPDMPNVMVYGGVTRLLSWDGPIYGVSMEGMHLYPYATSEDPVIVRQHMVSLSDLTADMKAPKRTQKMARLMRFLGFHDYRFISAPFDVAENRSEDRYRPRGDMR